MKHISLSVPDNKYQFFLELVQSLDFVKLEEVDIPEEHKALVRKRIEASSKDPRQLLDWDQVQDSFKLD
ncbi:addiction module protein [Cesiribacter sp. SM1]|uniref:addiction module protein n=1 Tax=Cesiribacter sp. SM1 TaxID=2861196 RepID=UPI001CD55628|nr:addiction module protein [Cesiribacter sp. SM1]